MTSLREEIEDILVDAYGEYEQMTAWEYAFTEAVTMPFQASFLGVSVEVIGFKISDSDVLQCLVAREQKQKQGNFRQQEKQKQEKLQRWILVEELDNEKLPEDFRHLLSLYRTWLKGND
jgi:hypothetical protein